MKKQIQLTLIVAIAFTFNYSFSQAADVDKKSALVFVEDGAGTPASGRIYASSARGASRNGNGNSNDAFGNIGDWSVDLIISEKSPAQAAGDFGNFTESGHPLYNLGDGTQSTLSTGFGALGWGSFGANAYNRSSGLGSVAMGFNTIAGPQDVQAGGIDGGNLGQFSAGYASRAIGNVSTATGFRNTASGSTSVALGNYNYATGDSTIALGKENWAEGASTVAVGFRNYAAGALNLKSEEEFKQRVPNLTFVAHDMRPSTGFRYWSEVMQHCSEVLGFHTDVCFDCTDYPTDGVVFRIDNLKIWNECGFTAHHPRGSIALKEQKAGVATTLLDVVWQTGKSGVVTPVAHLKPVMIGEAKVSRATLHNMEYINELGLEIGCEVEVIRSGEIIPRIVRRLN